MKRFFQFPSQSVAVTPKITTSKRFIRSAHVSSSTNSNNKRNETEKLLLLRKQEQQEEQDIESFQRRASAEASLCFCAACRKDVSCSNDNDFTNDFTTNENAMNQPQRDFFKVLEHHSFTHFVEFEEVLARSKLVKLADNNDDDDIHTVEEQEEDQTETTNNNNTNARFVSTSNATDSGTNAELLSNAIISSLLENQEEQQQQKRKKIHLVLIQDAVDHDILTVNKRLRDHLVYFHNDHVETTETTKTISQSKSFFCCFLVSCYRARYLTDFVISPLHEDVLNYYDCREQQQQEQEENSNDKYDNNTSIRSCIIPTPNNTRSVERSFYVIVELIAVLLQKLENLKLEGKILKKGSKNIVSTRMSRKHQRQIQAKQEKLFTLSVMSDHHHVWTNLKKLFGTTSFFDLERV